MKPLTKRLHNSLYKAAFLYRVTREKDVLYGYNDSGLKKELMSDCGLPQHWSYMVKLLRRPQREIRIFTKSSPLGYSITFPTTKQFDVYVSGLVVMWNTSLYTIKCMPKKKRLQKFAYL